LDRWRARCRHPRWTSSRHAAGLLALTFGLIESASNSWTSAPVAAPLAAGVVLLASFVWWQHRAPVPMIPPAVVKLRSFTTSCGIYLLSYAGLTGVYFYLTLLYQDVDGWTALRTGLSWLFMNIPFLVVARSAGRLSRRLPARAITGGGCLVTAAGILTTAIVLPVSYALDPQRYYWGVIGVVIIGAGVATSHEQGRKLLKRGLGTALGAVIGIALHHLIGSAQADPRGTLAVIVVAMSVGAYFITVNYAAFVTCLVITLVQLHAFTAPGGLDILLAYRLGENLLGAAVGLLVALLVLPVPTSAVIRTGLHGYLQALSSFAADLGTHLADPDPDVRLRGDSRALDHALFQTGLVVGHLVPHSARRRCADALLGRLAEGARQVRTIVRHVPPAPRRPGVATTVAPLIQTLTTTIAALDRHPRLTADDADLARTLTALHDLDRSLISIRAGGRIEPNSSV
jgi:hypothetical protein